MNRVLAKLLHFSQSMPLASTASAPNWANNFARARKIMAAPAPSDDLLTLLSTVDKSQFTEELLSVYDVVIINGPLGLGGPETRLLKRWADAVLFAVRWAKTRRSIARGVLESLRAGGSVTVPIGSVLTQVNLKRYAGSRLDDNADLLLERV